MLAGVLPLLVLVDCSGVRGAVVDELKLTNSDYASFADLGQTGLNALEDQVLDSLYKRRSGHDSPEIKCDLLNKILPCTGIADKVRYVVLSMLEKADQFEPCERLLSKLGYADCLLLRKLFNGPSIESITEIPAADEDTGARQEFCRAAKQHHGAVERIFQSLQQRAVDEGRKNLLQLAERGKGLDLAIYTLKAMNSSENMTLSSAFTELVNAWPGDAERRKKLLPAVTVFLWNVLNMNAKSNAAQLKLQGLVVRHVYASCDTERECFELFCGFPKQRVLSRMLNQYIKMQLNGDPALGFVRKYLAHVKKNFWCPISGTESFFTALLPQPAVFHTDKHNKWKDDPERFNLISTRWLRDMFEDLRVNPAHEDEVVVFMRKYMRMLDYDAFIHILLPLKWEEFEKLAVFMLKHLNAKGTEEYWQRLERDRQRTDSDDYRPKPFLSMLASIFKRSPAH
ncbi:hypothetical protein PAPHI01_0147 [Pancytospora philotis]|nr:hypothetical protein PAPHI01_0147 [Pancytospora philotis]